MNYLEQSTLAADDTFIRRVRQAIITAAIAISAEASSGNESIDKARLSLSTMVLREPTRWARIFVYGVATYSSLTAGSSDTVISNAVTSFWNAYAGANANQVS
jgi:hypothetical protein